MPSILILIMVISLLCVIAIPVSCAIARRYKGNHTKRYAIVVTRSWEEDAKCVLSPSLEKARKYLEREWLAEVGKNSDCSATRKKRMNMSKTYAEVQSCYSDRTDITEWRVVEVLNPWRVKERKVS